MFELNLHIPLWNIGSQFPRSVLLLWSVVTYELGLLAAGGTGFEYKTDLGCLPRLAIVFSHPCYLPRAKVRKNRLNHVLPRSFTHGFLKLIRHESFENITAFRLLGIF